MPKNNRKKGENEAIEILKTIGVLINESYSDTNKEPSMPDLQYADGVGSR